MTENSPQYSRQVCDTSEYYYEAVQIKVVTSGYYSLSSISSVYMHASLYESYFNPYDVFQQLLSDNSGGCPNAQFQITAYLKANITYVLVVTTSNKKTVGTFSVLVSGPNNVSFSRISKSNSFSCFNSNCN